MPTQANPKPTVTTSVTSKNGARQERIQTDIRSWLRAAVAGKDILHVGCADHDVDEIASSDRWLHAHLVKEAKSTLGLDILAEDCAKLRARGFDAVAGDACTIDIGRTFDVIVAGEIIEHVENPGQMLRNLARHLRPGGDLILTTPNAHFALHMVESMFFDTRYRWQPQHVAWYDPFTLCNMVERCGLKVERSLYFTRSRKLLALMKHGLPCWGWLSSSIAIVARRTD